MATLQRASGNDVGFTAAYRRHVRQQVDGHVVTDESDRPVAEGEVRTGGVFAVERPLARLVPVQPRRAPAPGRVCRTRPIMFAEQSALESDRRLIVRSVGVRPERTPGR